MLDDLKNTLKFAENSKKTNLFSRKCLKSVISVSSGSMFVSISHAAMDMLCNMSHTSDSA